MIMDNIVYQEVPDQVSLLFQISGCKLRCKGCHSPELWNPNNGIELTNSFFLQRIRKYFGLITCVVFFGGEWHSRELIEKLKIAQLYGLKTCLYTGEEKVAPEILEYLDYIKIGAWRSERGGLDSLTTNQVFLDLNTGEKLNYKFTHNLEKAMEMHND